MADNVDLLPDSGAGTVKAATDEVVIGGVTVHVPRFKLGVGADGTYSGDVSSANPLPVTFTGLSVALDAATLTALELIGIKGVDGSAIASNANPLPISDAAGSITVDGTVAATQSGTWTEANSAAIKAAVELIDNAISGSEMQVDVVAALPAGANNIGDVDVLTLPAIPAGDNAIGRVKLTDGSDVAEVNARTDGIVALEVADDMTSGETFRQALVASTDTTITFTQAVRLVRIKNESTTATVFVRDGAISSDTPSNAEIVGVAPAANVPSTEYYPFKTTTIHLRSAGTPTVNVTGFY